MVNVRKRGTGYQYYFEGNHVNGKRTQIVKSGFKTKSEAQKEGMIAYNDYYQTGSVFKPSQMLYSEFLDLWIEKYCKINLKYHTIEAYSNIIKNHIKPRIGYYLISQITPLILQNLMNDIYIEKGFSKRFLNNILKVLKGSFKYATDELNYIKVNPAINTKIPKYDSAPDDPAHIFTEDEIQTILNRFENNHCVYYAMLTAYYTGLRVSEVFGLTWNDIDFENKRLTVNKNILKKNQKGGTKGNHISGNSTTVWYFGTCKTQSSYRTIEISDTLLNALNNYKNEQQEHQKKYGDSYMKHYSKEVKNEFTNKPEIKIINASSEIEVALPEVKLVFIKNNGVFEGTDSMKYPFKVIHYELGINCRFHDFRDTHATRLIENGTIISLLDRLFYSTHFDKTMKVGASVISSRRAGSTSAVDEINKYFTICNMPIVSSSYWNEVHVFSAEDVEKDLEGLQTMRNLARNMAFMIKSINLGKEKFGLPQNESGTFTSFPDGL